jgi:hypothetical protein
VACWPSEKCADKKSRFGYYYIYFWVCICVCVCIRRILIYLDFFPFSYIRDDAARGPIEIFPLKGLAGRFSSLFFEKELLMEM